MNLSTSGLPVHHQLLESAQTHVHWIDDAIQLSHPLSSPSPSALNISQHQGLFKWVSSLHQVAKVLEFQLQHQSFNTQDWSPLGWTHVMLTSKFLKAFLLWPETRKDGIRAHPGHYKQQECLSQVINSRNILDRPKVSNVLQKNWSKLCGQPGFLTALQPGRLETNTLVESVSGESLAPGLDSFLPALSSQSRRQEISLRSLI